MTLNRLTTIYAVIATVLGLVFFLWGPVLLSLYGVPQLPSPVVGDVNAMSMWSGVAFVRTFGAVLFAFGVLLWFVRSISDPVVQRNLAVALFVGTGLVGLVTLIQQIAIWNSVAGWVTFGMLALFALGYGYYSLVPSQKATQS